MNYFVAINDKQLGICLRMLFAEKIEYTIVKTVMTSKHKIEFHIYMQEEDKRLDELIEKYEILIS